MHLRDYLLGVINNKIQCEFIYHKSENRCPNNVGNGEQYRPIIKLCKCSVHKVLYAKYSKLSGVK